MKYYLTKVSILKWLEKPCVYHIENDELYELDKSSFAFLKNCSQSGCNSTNREFIDYCLREGILTEEKSYGKRPPLKKSPSPSLRYLELQITNRCNLTCRHCYIGEKRHEELSVHQVRTVLKEFEEMQGLRVLISGGEPLFHRRFNKINEILPEFSIRKVLFTNGVLLNRERLKNLNAEEIQISIDGLEMAHDSLRGEGTFKMAIGAVRRSLDSGFQVSIATMVHPGNLKDFDAMERLFRNMGIKEWSVDVPCIEGRLKDNKEFQISPEVGGRYLRYGYGGGFHTSASGYACGLHLMAVMADGRVARCTFYSESAVGRIGEGLRKCWGRIKPIRLEELECDCPYLESCRGGCRYRAMLFDNPLGKDPYRCALYGII